MHWENLLKISPDDNMYLKDDDQGLNKYIRVGLAGVHTICSELERINLWPKYILDIPSGYGRVLRFIRAVFPNARIYASDIRKDAVDFCQKTLDVHALYSKKNFSEIHCPESARFDLIWSGSLVTHLTQSNTIEFINFCLENLSPEGILIMTSHGRLHYEGLGSKDSMGLNEEQIRLIKTDYESLGYGYGRYLKMSSQTYDYMNNWGVSLIKHDWFIKASSQLGFKILAFRERGWVGQDVIVIKR